MLGSRSLYRKVFLKLSRQNLTSVDVLTTKVDLRTVRVKILLMAVDPLHRYSNETERANEDIYDDFKLKKRL